MSTPPADFKIWDGLCTMFPQGSSGVDSFGETDSVARARALIEQRLEQLRRGEPTEQTSIYHQYPFPIVFALMATAEMIRALDFGGGLGQTYLSVRASLPKKCHLEFYILEHPEIVSVGQDVFQDDEHVRFVDCFDVVPKTVDVVHAGSSFQYVDDWRGLLAQFASMAPRYIVFGNLLAGDIRPFVTFQNNWGHQIPVRFHNLQEILRTLEEHGYELLFDAFHEQTILGKRQPLPLDHFPAAHRLTYGRNVIFGRA